MSEMITSIQRVLFPIGKQRAFIEQALEKVTLTELTSVCKCSTRTVRDWKREKFRMPIDAVERICQGTGKSFPKGVKIISAYAHTSEAGKKGGQAIIQKYGKIPVEEEFRKEQWEAWWEKKGKFTTHLPNTAKSILIPRKSKELAEFIGIMMGDGGISDYQCAITLHSIDDKEYANVVIKKIKELFGVSPSVTVRPDKAVRVIVVSRIKLVHYLHELGLPIGNKVKQSLDIPLWIKEDKKLSRLCVRGLVDTDGSVFTHTYQSKGTYYSYKKISFTSASPVLVRSVAHVLAENGMSPRIAGRDVRLDSVKDVTRYFDVIGSSNSKHLNRLTS